MPKNKEIQYTTFYLMEIENHANICKIKCCYFEY